MAESILYLHGVPQSGDMWRPFVERTGGLAPDLPGFGKNDKPAQGDYTFRGLARYVSELVAPMERYSLVVHDWGAVGLLAALDRPEALQRLVVIDAVPFLPGYRWHQVARAWRTPVLGELSMGLASKRSFKRLGRMQGGDPELVDALAEEIWPYFDHGTQRAILRLYRSAPPDVLAEAGRELGRIEAKTLVVWGERDPYIPLEFARAYADLLRGELDVVDGAGHWPWMERPEVVDRVAGFLSE